MDSNSTTATTETMIDSTESSEEFVISEELDIIFIVVVAFMTLFCALSNALTILVIKTSKKLSSSPFNIMLMSLCVSDFISALLCPISYLRLYCRPDFLPLSTFPCKVTWALDHWTSIATMHHVLAFVILRIYSIKRPHKIKRFTPRKAVYLVIAIWTITGAISGTYPMIVMGSYYENGVAYCDAQPKWFYLVTIYALYGGTLLLIVPSIAVVGLSVYLVALIKRRQTQRVKLGRGNSRTDEREKMAMIQVILIIASFIFGYSPEIFFRVFVTAEIVHVIKAWIPIFNQLALYRFFFLRISECMNPVLYNVVSSNMREATMQYLSRIGIKCSVKVGTDPDDEEIEIRIMTTPQTSSQSPISSLTIPSPVHTTKLDETL